MTNTPNRLRGRPRGSGKDDSELLRQVADLLVQDPTRKKTTAINQVLARTQLRPGEMKATVVRRLQHKFKEQGSELLEQARGNRATTVPSKQVPARSLVRRGKGRRLSKSRFERRQRQSARLVAFRKEAGLTQEDMAEKKGWSIDKVQELEEPTRETRLSDGEWHSAISIYIACYVGARAVKAHLSHRPESASSAQSPIFGWFREMREPEHHDQRCRICNGSIS